MPWLSSPVSRRGLGARKVSVMVEVDASFPVRTEIYVSRGRSMAWRKGRECPSLMTTWALGKGDAVVVMVCAMEWGVMKMKDEMEWEWKFDGGE
jgi:predicted  nucleic acid-binding Zn ribbon protein